jgi:hypothetical protein
MAAATSAIRKEIFGMGGSSLLGAFEMPPARAITNIWPEFLST